MLPHANTGVGSAQIDPNSGGFAHGWILVRELNKVTLRPKKMHGIEKGSLKKVCVFLLFDFHKKLKSLRKKGFFYTLFGRKIESLLVRSKDNSFSGVSNLVQIKIRTAELVISVFFLLGVFSPT